MASFKMFLVCRWTKAGKQAAFPLSLSPSHLVGLNTVEYSTSILNRGPIYADSQVEEIRTDEDLELECGSDVEDGEGEAMEFLEGTTFS
eukprot:scaffold24102_cov48-Prasinocladus_malaysianus.AAC.1